MSTRRSLVHLAILLSSWVVCAKDVSVELLRFATPYGSSLDNLVDVTPYSQLLKEESGFKFYSFIDTWVSNNTRSVRGYINNVTGECYAVNRSEGNGWQLSVDLIFWPDTDVPHPRQHPKVVPALSDASGVHSFGPVTLHEAKLVGSQEAPKVSSPDDSNLGARMAKATAAHVYRCNDKKQFEHTLLEKFAAFELEQLAALKATKAEEAEFIRELKEFFIQDNLVVLKPTSEQAQDHEVVFSFNKSNAEPSKGLPIFYANAYTDTYMPEDDVWWNLSFPFKPIGYVTNVEKDHVVIHLNGSCMPTAEDEWQPRLVMPRSTKALHDVQKSIQRVQDLAASARPSSAKFSLPSEGFLGDLDLSNPASVGSIGWPVKLGASEFEAQKVCVVTVQSHGRVIEKHFELPLLVEGDRVLAQVTSTGHGWAATQEQCGEYCKVKYQLAFDDAPPVEFMQWRDDCKKNPNGWAQKGTWFESRNGWCPGSVSAGVFADVTDKFQAGQGKHRMTLDTLVLSNHTGEYEPFTNWRGWLYGDLSMLDLHIALFVYPKAMVETLKASGRVPCSRAEAALLSTHVVGASWPKESPEPKKEKPVKTTDIRTVQISADGEVHRNSAVVRQSPTTRNGLMHQTLAVDTDPSQDSCFVNFESRSPWYVFNVSQPEKLEKAALRSPALVVPVLQRRLVQGDSRIQQVQVDRSAVPRSWSQVGLRIRLEKPGGKLEFDRWDRIGSAGVILNADAQTPQADAQAGAFRAALQSFVFALVCIQIAWLS